MCKTCGKERRINEQGNCSQCQHMHDYVPPIAVYICDDCGHEIRTYSASPDCVRCNSPHMMYMGTTE